MDFRRVIGVLLLISCAGLARTQTKGPFAITSTATTNCALLQIDPTRTSKVLVNVGPTTFSATLTVSVSLAGQAANATNVIPTGATSASSQSTITANGSYGVMGVAGNDLVQVCATAYTSGTATVYLSATTGVSAELFGGGSGGTNNPGGTAGQVQTNGGAVFGAYASSGIVKTTSGVPAVAASADVIALFSTCSSIQYLGADGACHTAAVGTITSVTAGTGLSGGGSSGGVTLNLVTPVSVTNGGSGASTLTGIVKGNGTSPFTIAASADVIALFSGTCNATTFLRGDGSCQSAGGGSVNVNGSAVSSPNFNGTTPAAGANGLNVTWQVSGSSVSAEVVGDGNAAHFLSGTGVYSTPAGALPSGTEGQGISNTSGGTTYAASYGFGVDATPYLTGTCTGSANCYTTGNTAPTLDATLVFNNMIAAVCPTVANGGGCQIDLPPNSHILLKPNSGTAGPEVAVPLYNYNGLKLVCQQGHGPIYSANRANAGCTIEVGTPGAYAFSCGQFGTTQTAGAELVNVTFIDATTNKNAAGGFMAQDCNNPTLWSPGAYGGFRQTVTTVPSAPTCSVSTTGGTIATGQAIIVELEAWTNSGPTTPSAPTTCAGSPTTTSTSSISITIPNGALPIIGYEALCKIGAGAYQACSALPTYSLNGDGSENMILPNNTTATVTSTPAGARSVQAIQHSQSAIFVGYGSQGWLANTGYTNGMKIFNGNCYLVETCVIAGLNAATLTVADTEVSSCDAQVSNGTCNAPANGTTVLATPGTIIGVTGLRLYGVHGSGFIGTSASAGNLIALTGFNNVIMGGTIQSNTGTSQETGISLINATKTEISGIVVANYNVGFAADVNSKGNFTQFADNGTNTTTISDSDTTGSNSWLRNGVNFDFGANPTASTAALSQSSAPYTAGTATTNFPMFYQNYQSATAVSSFSTAGTEFGQNAPSGFTGNLFDSHVNGAASVFSVTSGGVLNVSTGFQIAGAATNNNCLLGNGTNFVSAACPTGFTNPMTTLGDIIYENATPAAARLAGPTTPNSVPQVLTSIPTGGVAQTPAWSLSGVPTNPQTGTTYTVLATDRASYVTYSNASAIAVTLPQAGTAGFGSNFVTVNCVIGVGTATITPTTSTISYTTGAAYTSAAATLALATGQCAWIYSDNTNYFAILKAGAGTVTSVAETVPSGFAVSGSPITTSGTLGITYSVAAAGQVIDSSAANTAGFTATPTLGASGTIGTLAFGNATSGTVTLGTVAGALGSVTASLPANTGTVAETNFAQTFSALQTFGANASIAATAHGVLLSENTGAVVATAAGTTNQLFASGGAADPGYKSWADLDSTQYIAGGGTAQAQTATLAPAATALVNGLEFNFLPVAANTGAAPTLAVNGLTAKPITKLGTAALVANDLTTTAIASVIYDGTEFQLQNPQTNGGTVTSVAQTVPTGFAIGGSPVTTSGTLAITYSVATAGQVINSSAANTAGFTSTPALGVSGTAGTLSMFPASGNFQTTLGSAATASNTVNFFATAPTTGDLVDCVTASTTCTLTDAGFLATNVVRKDTTNAGAAAMTLNMSASTSAPSVQLPAVVGGTILAGTSTANLSAPIVIQNTNSSGNNTSITLGVTAPGTSTGQTVLNVNGASTGGDLVDFGTGGTWTAGVLSGQTIVDAFTPLGAIKTGTAPTVTTPGTGFYLFGTEGTEPASIASGATGFNMDSTSHCPIQWNNAVNVSCTAAWGAVNLFAPIARTSGASPYFQITIPTDTAQTAATESIGYQHVTATRTWATTGTVALQRENFFAGPTYASASASQTFTDAFTLYATPPVAGSNAIFTRGHTLGIVDSTSAASAITGGLVVATTLGTAATSVGIGGGNVNAGGNLTAAGTVGAAGPIQSNAANTALTVTGGIPAATTGASGTLNATGENVNGGSTASMAGGAATFQGGDNASSGATETAGAVTLRGGDTTNASAAVQTTGAVTIRGGNNTATGAGPTLGTVTITGGTQSGAATNVSGADVTIAGGLGTGNATPAHVRIKSPTLGLASGSTAETQVTHWVSHAKAGSTTSATATSIFNIASATNTAWGLEVLVHVDLISSTPNVCGTTERFSLTGTNNNGAFGAVNIVAGTTSTLCSAGTLTLAVTATAANPSVISVTPTWATITAITSATITVTIDNVSQQEIGLL